MEILIPEEDSASEYAANTLKTNETNMMDWKDKQRDQNRVPNTALPERNAKPRQNSKMVLNKHQHPGLTMGALQPIREDIAASQVPMECSPRWTASWVIK